MSDVQGLLDAIARDPDDLTAVCALVDALMDERDMLRSEADQHAERALLAARDARDMASAAELLRGEQPWYAELLTDILADRIQRAMQVGSRQAEPCR